VLQFLKNNAKSMLKNAAKFDVNASDKDYIDFANTLLYVRAMLNDITTSQSLPTFRHQLKTWLFGKSYPDIIMC